jgi:hypothetical protein
MLGKRLKNEDLKPGLIYWFENSINGSIKELSIKKVCFICANSESVYVAVMPNGEMGRASQIQDWPNRLIFVYEEGVCEKKSDNKIS